MRSPSSERSKADENYALMEHALKCQRTLADPIPRKRSSQKKSVSVNVKCKDRKWCRRYTLKNTDDEEHNNNMWNSGIED